MYKVLEKILANRLKKVIEKVISESKNALVKEHQISIQFLLLTRPLILEPKGITIHS